MLINCDECGAKISSKAVSCPKCGNPLQGNSFSKESMPTFPANSESIGDPIQDSLSYPLAIMFSKSSSPNYSAAVELAKLADKYTENLIGKTKVHVSAYSNNRLQMSRASALLQYISNLKSTKIYAGGKLLSKGYDVHFTLECYLTACACNDWQAHCHTTFDSTIFEKNKFSANNNRKKNALYLFPCKHLISRYGEYNFWLDPNLSSSPADQIQAKAVEKDCAWCPNFCADDFKLLSEPINKNLLFISKK